MQQPPVNIQAKIESRKLRAVRVMLEASQTFKRGEDKRLGADAKLHDQRRC
jgi:hypothetical protein